MQTYYQSGIESAAIPPAVDKKLLREQRRVTVAYRILVVFTALYYLRPEDVVPGLSNIPVAKVVGGLAVVALITGLAGGKIKTKLPTEMKLLLLLFAHLCLTIPFAYWHGGAFKVVFEQFAKGVIAAFLIALLCETFFQLRNLLWVQAAAMAAVTFLSVMLHRTENGRLVGALGGVFENPNDLAINIAVNWPLCVGFLFLARGAFKKMLWVFGIFVMLYAVQATYSRSGFLALAVGVAFVLIEFGIRGKRVSLIAAAFLAFFLVLAVPSHYRDRLTTIITQKEDRDARGRYMSGDSVAARRELLKESVEATVTHPIFGVGPGNFEIVVGHWHVAHNTYFELGAEAGLPALFLFLWILVLVYRNLRSSRKSQIYKDNYEFRILTGALYASFAAYLVGAFFSDTAFELFPYFLIAYTSALYRLAVKSEQAVSSSDPVGKKQLYGRLSGGSENTRLAWNRQ